MKNLRTRTYLAKGLNKGEVYEWLSCSSFPSLASRSFSSILALVSTRAPFQEWQNYLDHPLLKVISHIIHSFNLQVSSPFSCNLSCNSCKCNKMHKLSFYISSLISNSSLELIYSNAQDPSPVQLSDGLNTVYFYLIIIESIFVVISIETKIRPSCLV